MPLIVFEGIDGSGKTTQVEMTKTFLEANGKEVHVFREPGGTDAGNMAREILLHSKDPLHPLAQLMLFQFSRAQLVQTVVKPLLDEGKIVILDRYIGSTIAYQGYAQGQIGGNGLSTAIAKQATDIATSRIMPDIEIYLDVDIKLAEHRLKEAPGAPDNFERDMSFLSDVKDGYDIWYKSYCYHPYVYINANEGESYVNSNVLKAIWTNNDIIK